MYLTLKEGDPERSLFYARFYFFMAKHSEAGGLKYHSCFIKINLQLQMLLAGMESAGFTLEWQDAGINSIIECLEYTLMTVISALSKVIHVIVGIFSDKGVFWDSSRTWK